MPTENYEFTDVSDQKYNSETKLTSMEGRKNGGGCFVSSTVAVFLIILAAVLAVAVGLIVFFAAGGKDLVCKCDMGSSSSVATAAIKDQCIEMAEGGDTDVCNKCPESTAQPGQTTPSPDGTTVPGTQTTATPKRITDVRLPTSVIPIHYKLRLQPYMYGSDPDKFTFKGFVNIRVRCVEATDNITLHAVDLDIDTESLQFNASDPSDNDPVMTSTDVDDEREFFIFRLNKNMEKDKEYEMTIKYSAPLTKSLNGLYLSSYYKAELNKTMYLATTQFQPTDARRALPCFDEPAIKATFDITLVRKSDLISIANTPINHTTSSWTEDDGITYQSDVYQMTPKMSTYLLAFVICDFTYSSGKASNGIEYRAFSRPEVVNSTAYALEVGLELLPYFEGYFNSTYPLPKQDMIAVPDFSAGAMENWGLIIYRETSMLYSIGVSNSANKERVAIVVSHELAHQWFGDLVTPSWWDDLWLNEGFATFMQYLGVDHIHSDWKMFDRFFVVDISRVLIIDSLVTSHPVYVPVYNPDEINEIFDEISYSKGGSIIRMMRHFLGIKTFERGLMRYLDDRKFDAAFHDDLWKALEKQAQEEGKNIAVKEIMDTWVLQMNYPVVMVTRDFNNLNMVQVSQSRFLMFPFADDPGKYPSPFGFKWTIPITITSSVNPRFNLTDKDIHWLYKNQTSAYFNIGSANLPSHSDTNGWILANTEQNGFYRVNYQVGNWKALVNQLQTDHTVFSIINRAQIINDAFNLAKPGTLDMEIALNSVDYLHKEHDFIPWQTSYSELSYISEMLSLSSTYGMFQKFMVEKSKDPFNFYGMNNTGATHNEGSARARIAHIACSYGNENCTKEAVRQYREWMNNPSVNNIDPDLKGLIYCTAVALGGWEEWSFALKIYKETPIASESSMMLQTMACTNKQWIISHYLKMIMMKDSPIRSQDSLSVIGYIGSQARSLTWQFYKENFDVLSTQFKASFFSWSKLVKELTSSFNTEYRLKEVQDLLNSNLDKVGTAKSSFTQAIETIQMNIKWMEINYPRTHKWFADRYNMV